MGLCTLEASQTPRFQVRDAGGRASERQWPGARMQMQEARDRCKRLLFRNNHRGRHLVRKGRRAKTWPALGCDGRFERGEAMAGFLGVERKRMLVLAGAGCLRRWPT